MTNLPPDPRDTFVAPPLDGELHWVEIDDRLWIASRDDAEIGRVEERVAGWLAQIEPAEPLGLFFSVDLARLAVEERIAAA